MDIDPRLADPRAGSSSSFAVGSVGVSTATPPAHPHGVDGAGGGSGGGGRPLGFLPPPPHHHTPIQSAPPVFASTTVIPSGSGSAAAALADQKRPRACESCRGLKVRCEPSEANPFATCKRCAKANRECIFTAPSRKRQKKSDSKVAELEKKIDALTASLNATRARQARGIDEDDEEEYGDDGDTPGTVDAEFSPISRPPKRLRHEDPHQILGDGNFKGTSSLALKGGKIPTTSYLRPTDEDMAKYVFIDVVDRGILSMETATKIFNHYVEDMVPHLPAVVFPPDTTAEDIRWEKPTLFLAILAAASGVSDPALHKTLYNEISRAFAERVMINGEKSLELVQSLTLCSMWYYTPDHFQELKFYMYIHQAAVMALDIGITKKRKIIKGSVRGLPPFPTQKASIPSSSGGGAAHEEAGNERGGRQKPDGDTGPSTLHPPPAPVPPVPPLLRSPFPDPEAIETRRALLACYWSCCNVSMALRRPNLLRFTDFMDECLEVLESSPQAAASDKAFCQWVKLQKIADEIGIGFAFDDPNANVTIDDQRVQFSLKGFAKQLEDWKSKCPQDIWEGAKSLQLAYNIIMIYAHEIALHRDHNVDDFQPPYTESMMREPSIKPNELLSSFHLDAISRCLSSSHQVLETFMGMTIQAIRSVPVFTFVRTSYACIILIKLYFSASHPQSELGKVIDKNSLKVDEYMDRLLDTLKKAADGKASKQAGRFTAILQMIRHWYSNQKAEIDRGSAESVPEPTFKRLGLSEGRHPPNTYGAIPMEGMETPRSMDDISAANTPEHDKGHHDTMRPPLPPRSSSLNAATPLQILSTTALESPHHGQYASAPSPTSNMGMTTPRSAPPSYGKWPQDHDLYAMGHGNGPITPVMGNNEMTHSGHSGHSGQSGHMGYGLGGDNGGVHAGGPMDYAHPVFTGNGEYMHDTFWGLIEEPMTMFDLGGVKYS
ncbi:uncharacterized protein H6S33_005382 [Morchella sextelata]|uniref:uncharacterized protein n=1 Tax=Morchella sextelata TaxID=1174677 RepID=UPI001D052ABB|nr:uncharacterized protein H6S33_005382 [Morchella sextelata]KAH0613496.1 hypothetical protein H6S33_005382 [Morchella sextelata]